MNFVECSCGNWTSNQKQTILALKCRETAEKWFLGCDFWISMVTKMLIGLRTTNLKENRCISAIWLARRVSKLQPLGFGKHWLPIFLPNQWPIELWARRCFPFTFFSVIIHEYNHKRNSATFQYCNISQHKHEIKSNFNGRGSYWALLE